MRQSRGDEHATGWAVRRDRIGERMSGSVVGQDRADEQAGGAVSADPTPVSLAAIAEFALERFFDRFEFAYPFQLGSSDPETLSLAELLADYADDDGRARWASLTLGYRTAAGDPELRDAIAALYRGRRAEDVVVTVGASEALLLTFMATLQAGDRAVALTPAYQSLLEVPRALGARLDLVEARAEDAWRFPLQRLLDALQPGVRLLVLNVPHNPTGATLTASQLARVVERCEQLGIRIVGDEVYRGLEWASATPPPITDLSARACSIGVTSKVYGLAGLRIGWIVTGDPAVRQRIVAIKDYTTLCASGPSETLAAIALRAHARLRDRTRVRCLSNMQQLDAFVAAHPDLIEWRHPAASTVGLARMTPTLLERHAGDPERVLAAWRDRAGVVVSPGSAFGAPPEWFRIGFGRADLPRALEALAASEDG